MGLSVKQALLRRSEAGMDGVVRKTGIFTEKACRKGGKGRLKIATAISWPRNDVVATQGLNSDIDTGPKH